MVGDKRQGCAIVAVMAIIFVRQRGLNSRSQTAHHGTVPTAVGAATEGTETRFGVPDSAIFATGDDATSTGAVDSFHDSYTSLGGAVTAAGHDVGEVAPGGTGSGLYGMLILAVLSVFVAGLMVGRTPEYLGKKIGGREIKFASLYLLTTPALVLVGTGARDGLPGRTGRHAELRRRTGFSEVLYAFTSAANNNGSRVRRHRRQHRLVQHRARPRDAARPAACRSIFVLGLAGSLARQQPVPASAGTLPTHRPLFVGMLTGVTVIVVALTYFPALALGPLAEGSALMTTTFDPRRQRSPRTRPASGSRAACSTRAAAGARCPDASEAGPATL